MTTQEQPEPARRESGLLSSSLVARLQGIATRLRFLLAFPVAALLFLLTDRGPMWPGVIVVLAGESLQLWATAHLRKNILLVKSGPYAWLRNPMYTGRFFVGLGFALLTWRWFVILPYVVIYPIYAQARVLGEERRLVSLFGAEYTEYCAAVHRWLPLPPKHRLSDNPWSWNAVLRNHELRVAAGVVLALCLLKWRLETFGPFWGRQ
jgi:protein-S-isoprenylcysteine O-methyltransferase Ste14